MDAETTMLYSFHDVLLSDSREKVLYGGSGSGKTYTVQQYAILKGLEEAGQFILIVMETIPGVLVGMFYPIQNMLRELGIRFESRETVPIRISLPNGHQLLFTSADKSEKLKHYANVRKVIINEATALSLDDYNQLMNRMGRTHSSAEIIHTFNPIDEHHWLVERYVRPYLDGSLGGDVAVHHSTYHDNPFLAPEWCAWLESKMSADSNFYRVYALGEPGHLEGLVYLEGMNWHHSPLDSWPSDVRASVPQSLGLDFGFNDPTALVAQWESKGTRYAHELLYSPKMTQSDLLEFLLILFESKGWPKTLPIYYDAAEPARGADLKRSLLNALPAHKDIAFGIDAVKAVPMTISEESVNIIRELRNYRWEERNGQTIDRPVDAFNHSLDAIRYAVASLKSKPDSSRFMVSRVGRIFS